MEFSKRFKVNYNYTIGEEDIPSYEYVSAPIEYNNDKSLMKVTYAIELDETKNVKSMTDLLNKYGVLQYTVNGVTKTINNLVKQEPGSIKLTKTAYMIVPRDIESASEISLSIKIRNVEYIYKIK